MLDESVHLLRIFVVWGSGHVSPHIPHGYYYVNIKTLAKSNTNPELSSKARLSFKY